MRSGLLTRIGLTASVRPGLRLTAPVAAGIIFATSTVGVQTNVYYVRAGGSGNGTDWANAYSTLPATLVRGATYYIADGTYSGYTFDDPASSTAVTTIKKATLADHGTSTGWQNSYGDGQATFNGRLDFATSYHTVDGNTDATGSYGFVLLGPGTNNLDIGEGTTALVTNITVRDLSVNNQGIASARGIRFHGARNVLISNVEVWNSDNDLINFGDDAANVIIEHSYLHTRNSAGIGTHADAFEIQGVANEITLRHTRINWDGQQLFWGGTARDSTWYVYGNRFYGGPNSGKAFSCHDYATNLALYFHNNTVNNLNIISAKTSPITRGDARNNLFYGNRATVVGWGGMTHSHNWFQSGMDTSGDSNAQVSSANPFVNAAAADFRLVSGTNAGQTLGGPYDVDPLGTKRGADGAWDRGALECASCGSTTPVYTAPAAPTDVRVIR